MIRWMKLATLAALTALPALANANTLSQYTVHIACKIDGSEKQLRGSGVVVSDDGHILTVKHLYGSHNPQDIQCFGEIGNSAGNDEIGMTFRRQDSTVDAALFQMDPNNTYARGEYPFARFCPVQTDHRFQQIDAVGFPAPKKGKTLLSARRGILGTNYANNSNLLETDILTTRGMSGGGVYLSGTTSLLGLVDGEAVERSTGKAAFYGILPIDQIEENILTTLQTAEAKDCLPTPELRDIDTALTALKGVEPDVVAFRDMKADLTEINAMRAELAELAAIKQDLIDLKAIKAELAELAGVKQELMALRAEHQELVALVSGIDDPESAKAFSDVIHQLTEIMQEDHENNPRKTAAKVKETVTEVVKLDTRMDYAEAHLEWTASLEGSNRLIVSYNKLVPNPDIKVEKMRLSLNGDIVSRSENGSDKEDDFTYHLTDLEPDASHSKWGKFELSSKIVKIFSLQGLRKMDELTDSGIPNLSIDARSVNLRIRYNFLDDKLGEYSRVARLRINIEDIFRQAQGEHENNS